MVFTKIWLVIACSGNLIVAVQMVSLVTKWLLLIFRSIS